MGDLKAMVTIMILNICIVFPDMYIINAVIGNCLTGARATSQAFLSLRTSISAAVGGARVTFLETSKFFCHILVELQY